MSDDKTPVAEEPFNRSQLRAEVDRLIGELEQGQPAYSPPPFTLAGLIQLLEQSIRYFAPSARLEMLRQFRQQLDDGAFDMETLRGAWYLAQYTLEMQADIVKRHLQGDYETDAWGLDWEILELIRPLLDFSHNYYFRVQTQGIEQIPDYGRTLLVVNHAGPLPWDLMMVTTAVLNQHPSQRLTRGLYPNWLASIPFVPTLLDRLGQVKANADNTRRLLDAEELVAVFTGEGHNLPTFLQASPRLNSLGRSGFVKLALAQQTPIIPVAIAGASPWPGLSNLTAPLTTALPASLRLPWLGLLGLIPLPARWTISFGPPLDFNHYGRAGADNVLLVDRLSDQVRQRIELMKNGAGPQ